MVVVGYMPIYEKENAFTHLHKYDQVAIIDSDIYIRPTAQNIFEDLTNEYAFGAVAERELPCAKKYKSKIRKYSKAAFENLTDVDWKWDHRGAEFYNMGMMVINCQKFLPYLKGQTAEQFIRRPEFKDFVDGKGAWKWSTDQTLLNYFLKKYKVPVRHMNPKWNGLYTAVKNLDNCEFIHFFLKDKLPDGGENIKELMRGL